MLDPPKAFLLSRRNKRSIANKCSGGIAVKCVKAEDNHRVNLASSGRLAGVNTSQDAPI
jgi:hypothetical protein